MKHSPLPEIRHAIASSLDERYEREGKYADKEGRREASAIWATRSKVESFENIDDPVEYSARVLEAIDRDRMFHYGLGPEVYDGRGIYGSIEIEIHERVMKILERMGKGVPQLVQARIDEIRKENKHHQLNNYNAWMRWFDTMHENCKSWREKPWEELVKEAGDMTSPESLKMLLVCRSKAREFECMLDNNPRSIGFLELEEELSWYDVVERYLHKDNVLLGNDRYGQVTAVFLPYFSDIYLTTHRHEIIEEHEDYTSYSSTDYVRVGEIEFALLRNAFETYLEGRERPEIPGVSDAASSDDWHTFFTPHPNPPYALEA